MKKLAAICIALMASACAREPSPEHEFAYTCPALPKDSGYTVATQRGPDFLICILRPAKPSVPPAELYIGNFPEPDPGLEFLSFTASSAGPLAWFSAPRSSPSQPSRLVTYISTGQPFPTVLKLTVFTSGGRYRLAQPGRIAEQVIRASMRPNKSFKPNPLRGSA